jgi:quinol monooxygenase YgiN
MRVEREGKMLVRVLTMRVRPGRFDDWKRYTREIGFPGMLAQPGCTKVWRMRRHGADEGEYQVVTLWDSMASLERFKSSQAMRDLSASAAELTIPPYAEVLYAAVPD